MDVYKKVPEMTGENYRVRKLRASDADALFSVYSDENAVPLFNGDNCHGDDFHYATPERMREAVSFWLTAYDNGWFVRFAIADIKTDKAVGTVELFHRDDEKDEAYGNCGLLRLDLASERERADDIAEIIGILKDRTFELFYCDKIVTKIKPFAAERLEAAKRLGFAPIKSPLVGHEGELYYDYYILRKAVGGNDR